MQRALMIEQLEQTAEWDLIIVGGGATGLGSAVDAASRGLKTLLIEKADFAKGTSSRSTKLVHGGVRYLAQGNIKLVKEALRERGHLLENAPHICSSQPFLIPVYNWFDKYFYRIGLKVYDLLSGKLSLGDTKILSAGKTIEYLPFLRAEDLKGSILYFDGQFDDSRLAIDLATTSVAYGATILNYVTLTGFIKKEQQIIGIECRDEIGEKNYSIFGKSFINGTGVFTDAILQMDDAETSSIVQPSQGVHLVVQKEFFNSNYAMMVPKTSDGRVFFAVPWHNAVVLGTTDTAIDRISVEPKALNAEIDFILTHFNQFNTISIARKDIKSVFVGLRPLVKVGSAASTALISRDHTIIVSPSGLVTITGGKWTTYRKMAEEAVNNALFVSKQAKRPCVTESLKIGNEEYKVAMIQQIIAEDECNLKRLHVGFPYTIADLIYAIRFEFAQTVEDLLARRTRILFLDAKVAKELTDFVAELLAKELKKDDNWVDTQVELFKELAGQYLVA